MAKEIKQKIVLEGEKEYRQALKEAQRNLKTLRSELKAETAELGRNATEQQKAETKAKSLKAQIAEQEKVVKTLREALEKAKSQYGDNADVTARWEQQLNSARASLADMRNELDGIGSSFDQVGDSAAMATVATKSVADSLERLSDIGEAISSGIESAFTGMISTAKDAIAEVWADMTDLAARSNDLVDLAGMWNTDINTIQKYKGAVADVSGSIEDLNTLVTKINSTDSKKIAELTGVSAANYEDQWKYAMAVMDALSMLDATQRNAAGFEIFGGKGATRAFDLLNDWQTVQNSLATFDAENGGYGLTAEQMQDMSTLYDQINGMYERWGQLKDMVEYGLFGQLSLDLTSNAINILDALKDYMNAETPAEREAAIQQIEDNITAMFEAVEAAIRKGLELLDALATELQGSENPTARALGDVLSGLQSALEWLVEHQNDVKKAFETVFGMWLFVKLAAIAGKLGSIITQIETIQAFKGVSAATSAAGGGATTAAAGGLGLAGWGGIAGIGLIGAGFAWARNERLTNENIRGSEKAIETAAEQTDGLEEAFFDFVSAEKAVQDLLESEEVYTTEGMNRLAELEEAAKAASERFWDIEGSNDVWDKYSAWRQENSMGSTDWTLPAAWWQSQIGGNTGEQVTSSDIQNLNGIPAKMQAAITKGMTGIRVNLDGRLVGNLVAPYVSEYIAGQYTVQ